MVSENGEHKQSDNQQDNEHAEGPHTTNDGSLQDDIHEANKDNEIKERKASQRKTLKT